MFKKLSIFAWLALGMAYSATSTAADATYNTQTNILSIPSVNVGGVTHLNVNVLLNPDAFGNGWHVLPGVPDCMMTTPVTCTDSQPQLISITISGPDTIPEGTSATYYAQSKWYWYSIADTKIQHIVTKGDSDLKIGLSGSASAVIEGTTVTAKQVLDNTDILLTVYDSFNGVVASATKKVTITNVKNRDPIVSTIPNMQDLYSQQGTIFKLANGQVWSMSKASGDCVLPGPPVTSTNPNITIYFKSDGSNVMTVEGSPTSCPVEPIQL